jgi:hypothetical protein
MIDLGAFSFIAYDEQKNSRKFSLFRELSFYCNNLNYFAK